jgi:hypothetical protein
LYTVQLRILPHRWQLCSLVDTAGAR